MLHYSLLKSVMAPVLTLIATHVSNLQCRILEWQRLQLNQSWHKIKEKMENPQQKPFTDAVFIVQVV